MLNAITIPEASICRLEKVNNAYAHADKLFENMTVSNSNDSLFGKVMSNGPTSHSEDSFESRREISGPLS
jgi:hypothetical protein